MADLHNVYNLLCPSPLSLMELAGMEIALILWRREIQQHIMPNGTLRERYPRKRTSLRCLIPEIPSTIIPVIEKYVGNLESSIIHWISYHIEVGLLKFNVLSHFLDFVCHFDGNCCTIHYARTAKRFVACTWISNDEKFRMACHYCLEDDILKIWPDVASRMSANEIDYHLQHQLYYWVCRLKNQSPGIVLVNNASSIEELILRDLYYMNEEFEIGEWPAVEYFLNRLPSDVGMKNMVDVANTMMVMVESEDWYNDDLEHVFLSYILAKLSKPELKKLVNEEGHKLINEWWSAHVLRIWSYIKNEITKDGFCRIVKYILKCKLTKWVTDDRSYWCDLWTSAPDHLKQAAIQHVLLVVDSSYFRHISKSFLPAVLSDTPIDDRRTFWNEHWETLIAYNYNADEVRVLMNLCFNNDEEQMNKFKESHQEIHSQLKGLFREGFLSVVEKFLTFWYPNQQTVREIRFKLLHNNFIVPPKLITDGEASALNEFIDNAYEGKDLAIEFKNKLLTIPEMQTILNLKIFIRYSDVSLLRNVMEFLDNFAVALTDEVLVQIKKREIVPELTAALNEGRSVFSRLQEISSSHDVNNFDEFEKFVNWLFKSCDEIEQFKKTLHVDIIIENLIRDKAEYVDRLKNRRRVDEDFFRNCFQFLKEPESLVKKFLEWYFTSPEAVEEFVNKYCHDAMFNRLLL